MDLTPQDVRDVQFREKMRGYHQDDVDQFLVQVATTLERLSLRLQESESRSSAGAARDDEIATTEESLKRTLILAQRTADLAMKEAREEADRLLAEARAEHERLQTQSDEIKRQLIDESQVDIRAELAELEGRRDALVADVERLSAYLEAEKGRLSALLRDTLQHLDDGSFALTERPELSEPPRPVTEIAAAPALPTNGHLQPAEQPDAQPDTGPDTQTMAAVEADEQALVAAPASDVAAPGPGDDGEVDLREDATIDDPFLAELRLAVTDDQPLGPGPDDLDERPEADDVEEIDFYERDREVGGRLGSRLRRRR